VDGWSWHNGKIDNMLKVVLGCFGRLEVLLPLIRRLFLSLLLLVEDTNSIL
jgi:hypothetical protein